MLYSKGSKGYEIKEIQSFLYSLGYRDVSITGVFEDSTEEAVRKFQLSKGLLPTGIVDKTTYEIIEKIVLGYDIYVVEKGDTWKKICDKFKCDLDTLLISNLKYGSIEDVKNKEIIIPFKNDIVRSHVECSYEMMRKMIKGLKIRYPFIEHEIIGKTVMDREIYCIKLGKGDKKVFYNAAHDGMSSITSLLLMKFIEDYCKAYTMKRDFKGKDIEGMWNKYTLCIVPMVNPDGVEINLNGITKKNPYYSRIVKWNKEKDLSKGWHSNIRGIDLNLNYDIAFEKGKSESSKLNVKCPNSKNYGGIEAFCEPETRAIAYCMEENKFDIMLCYDTFGDNISYKYVDKDLKASKHMAEKLCKVSGYKINNKKEYGTCKSYFIHKYKRPAYKVLVGKENKKYDIKEFNELYITNINILLGVLE